MKTSFKGYSTIGGSTRKCEVEILDDSSSPSPSAVIYVFVDDNNLDLEVLKEVAIQQALQFVNRSHELLNNAPD
jgi:hypothetical protein